MAAVLNLDTASWARVALYEDDSLEAWFADGSKISLTACATAFTREETKAMRDRSTGHSQHDAPSSVHQFTAYAARGCRERVRQLLSFRNYFAERPFLPPFLFRQDILISDDVIEYVAWPTDIQRAISCNLIGTSTGGTRLVTTDGCAWVELASHGQTLTTCHLARLPHERDVGRERESVEDRMATLGFSDHKEKKVSYEYVWTRALYSATSIPDVWRHPLTLLLQHRSHDSHMTSPQQEKENDRTDSVLSSSLPHTLPLACHNSHLHLHSQTQQEHRRLKVLLFEGILYRVYYDKVWPYVEALPNQNTVLRSHDLEGRFFECWCVDEESGRVQRSMYCVDHIPASTSHTFSVTRVLGQAARLLDQASKWTGSVSQSCWKIHSPLPSPPSSPRHYTVPGLGRLTVWSNGHVRCVFADRTIIDLYDPRCVGTSSPASSPGGHAVRGHGGRGAQGVQVAKGVWIGEHLCRVMQPNGRYVMISTLHPPSHHRYIEVVREWCEWMAQPEGGREQFYEGTIYDQNTQRRVLAELSKIQRFNAILTSQTPTTISSSGDKTVRYQEESDTHSLVRPDQLDLPPLVRTALQRTGEVVNDIDAILGQNSLSH